MKKLLLAIIILSFLPMIVNARDYVIDCVSENYNEETDDYKHHLQIYHALQINSIAGQKILILKGNNYQYRKWLREYIVDNKKMIIKIPDNDVNNFISSRVYSIDVASVYPVNDKMWDQKNVSSRLKVIAGERHILIVDSNIKRRKLINQVIEDLGYPVTFLSDATEALRIFMAQPANFYMVIANYDYKNFNKTNFVEKLTNISPQTPIIVGGIYNNKKVNEKLFNDFSRMNNVTVRPVILKNLSRLIINLLKDSV